MAGFRNIVQVVQAGDGDRDISYNDSFDISEQLAGTLGPVQTQDSTDFNDEFVARELVLQESLDASDELRPIEGLAIDDSADFNDRLSGTIGPIAAPDTLDATDDPVFGPLVLQDSFDTSVTASSDLSATALDSFDVTARLGQITRFDQEQFFAADAFGEIQQLQVDDSVQANDELGAITGLAFGDMFDVGTTSNASITARNNDSFAASDLAVFGPLTFYDSLDAFDARGIATISNARLWPNTVVSNTGFTNPNNATDLSEATGAQISATQSGGLVGGNSVTVTGNIQISCPDINIVPTPSVSGVVIEVGYTTTASGGLQNGNSVSVAIDYSLNDGATWTTLVTATTPAQTANPTFPITATYAQLQQLRFRAVGQVVSGTTLVVGGANQTFQIRYARALFNASQTL